MRLFLRGWLLAILVLLLLPTVVLAVTASPTLVFPWQQVWPVVIGALVPLATYALNHVGPWVTEPIKAIVLVVVAAVATALYTALATSVIGFNDATLQLVLTGIISALGAHKLLWHPSGISVRLGGGTNVQTPPKAAPKPRKARTAS